MEPWQEEELRQRRWTRHGRRECIHCREIIYTERCLDMGAFGIPGLLCERCLDRNMLLTIDTQEG